VTGGPTRPSGDCRTGGECPKWFGRRQLERQVERIQERTDGHALISTGIGAEDDAVGKAEKAAAAYRAYAKGTGKPSSVTVHNVYGDSLVTR
jgi:hypothetical protein